MPRKKAGKMIVLCCGEYGRAVVIGRVTSDPVPGEAVRLADARMVLYWAAECGGLLGLAARGPRGSTRITHAVPRLVETRWQEWVEVAAGAAEEVDQWPAY